MANDSDSARSRPDYSSHSWWSEQDESISRMSRDERDDIARQAVHLFYRLATRSDNDEPWEKFSSDLDAAAPAALYLYLQMTAGERFTSPIGVSMNVSQEQLDKQFMWMRRLRFIAVSVAKGVGYDLTPEDWPLPAQSTTPEEDT